MPSPADLPLDGYYRGGPDYCDMFCFLRFTHDCFWFLHQVVEPDEPAFDFPTYWAALEVDSIKQEFPMGNCQPAGKVGWLYRCGRYTRQADVPVLSGGVEVARLAEALVMTSWMPDRGEFDWAWEIKIVAPGVVVPTLWGIKCRFVPDLVATIP